MKSRCLLIASLIVVAAGSFGSAVAQRKGDRAAALRLAELAPPALEDWNAGRPRVDWRNGGGSARALYWSKKPGAGSYTITFEVRTRGLDYKKDLLTDRRRAKRRGYTIRKIAETPALVKTSLGRIELRMWYKDRILILAKGKVKLETLEDHLKTIDYEKLGMIR